MCDSVCLLFFFFLPLSKVGRYPRGSGARTVVAQPPIGGTRGASLAPASGTRRWRLAKGEGPSGVTEALPPSSQYDLAQVASEGYGLPLCACIGGQFSRRAFCLRRLPWRLVASATGAISGSSRPPRGRIGRGRVRLAGPTRCWPTSHSTPPRSHSARRALPLGASRAPTGTSPGPRGEASGTFKARLEKRVGAPGARLAARSGAARRPSSGPTRRREWEARHYRARATSSGEGSLFLYV